MKARTRVKVCGLTRAEDASLAVELGADAVGFVLWPQSPRAITAPMARGVHESLPAFVARVGVFVNPSRAEVAEAIQVARLDVVQLHGDEPVEAFLDLGARVMKVATLESDDDVARVLGWPQAVTPLVDAVDRERRGGTGRLADWNRAARLAARRPIVLAGGLTADNVGEAIARVKPWAVDVSSGVEQTPGIKSRERLRSFTRAVVAATREDQ